MVIAIAFVEKMQNVVVIIIGTPTKTVAKVMEVQVFMHVQQYNLRICLNLKVFYFSH